MLDDSTNYPGDVTTADVAVTIWLYTLGTGGDGGSAQEEMFYIISDTTKASDAINAFSYSPTLDVTYTFTYTIAFETGPSGTVSSLVIDSNTDIEVGVETDTALSGAWTARLTGTLDDGDTSSIYEDFTMNLIKLEGTLADQTYRV